MFRAELKLEALCETCPETHVEKERGTGCFALAEELPETYTDFAFKLEFTHGWEVVNESYENDLFYCPKCKAERIAKAA